MTWDAYHRRDSVLHEVMIVADDRRDGVLPWSDVAAADAVFDTPEDLLGALQMRWHTRLSGAIERELTEQPWDLERAVVHAWRALAGAMPGVRAVLDAHSDHGAAMQRARRKEWALLATASGLAAMDDAAAVRLGREVETRARAVTIQHDDVRPTRRGWLTRLRHALAA